MSRALSDAGSLIQFPITGWYLDKVRRVPYQGENWYEVTLIRKLDGGVVHAIAGSLGSAMIDAVAVVGKLNEL